MPGTLEPPAGFRLGVLLLLAYLVLPFVFMVVFPGTDAGAFNCRVEVERRLGATLNGTLEFLLVDTLEGESPAPEFVVVLDHGYTAGIEPARPTSGEEGSDAPPVPETPSGSIFGVEGRLMTRDVYYGEQYLFFDYPQIYASQVRYTYLWPSQVDRLKTLFLSPFVTLVSIYWVWALPFAEEYSPGSWLLVIARFVLICAAVAVALVWRRRRKAWTPGLIWALGVYAILAVILAVPSL